MSSTLDASGQHLTPTVKDNVDGHPGLEEADTPDENTQLLNRSKRSKVQYDEKKIHYRGIDKARFWWLFGSILFGNTIAFFDSTLTASSHPVITSYFHSSNSASWLSTVFYLTSTVSQPLYARISDTIGRRPVSLFATTMFFAGTAWCALAQTIGSFIAARALCGVGAGGVMAMAGIIVGDLVKIEYRGIYQSYYNVAFGAGNSMGAAFGGLLCDKLGWRAAFGIQLPFIFAFGTLSFFFTPANLGPNLAKSQGKTIAQALKDVDIIGAMVLSVVITGLILGINLGGNIFNWTHPIVLTSLILSVISSIVLIGVEKRAIRPMLPLPLLSKIPHANLMWSNFFSGIVINTVLFNVPLYLQAVRQTTATTSGLYLISPLIGVTIAAIFSGFFISWTRRIKPMTLIGSIFLLAGSVALILLQKTTPSWLILILISGTSIGQGFFAPSATIALLALNSQDDQAVVVTTLALIRNLGSTLGVAISSWVLQNTLLLYLNQLVTNSNHKNPPSDGEDSKEAIILKVRKSVQAIRTLDPMHKAQVIEAYSKALRLAFASGVLFAFILICIVLPIRIPKVEAQVEKDNHDATTTTNTTGVFKDNDNDNDDTDEDLERTRSSVFTDEDDDDDIDDDVEANTNDNGMRTTPKDILQRYQDGRRPSFDASI